jgi:pyrroloquinoline quinone (PQQ) biosynthesis protein C
MKQCGADTSQMEKFIATLKNTGSFDTSFSTAETPNEAKNFVNFTFSIINSNKDYLQSAIFTFGREDLIPSMFVSIVNDIHKNFPESISIFKYYLERHIEVDGDHHSHLALQMTSNLCENNQQYWEESEKATIESLKRRIELWDGAYNQILSRKIAANNG